MRDEELDALEEAEREIARLEALNGRLVAGIQALFQLLDDHDLVRNIQRDHDPLYFMKQGLRITNVLLLCNEAIVKAGKPNP